MKFKKSGLMALSALAALSLAACSSGATSNEAESSATDEVIKLRVQSHASIAAEPLYVGIEEGFFADEGLEIEIVDLPDAAAGFAAAQSGQIDLAFSTTISVLQAVRKNLPLVMVAPSDGLNPAAVGTTPEEGSKFTSVGLYVSEQSGITDISGLSDASIAVIELKSQPDATIESVLQENGHSTENIEWLQLGFVPALDAVKSGEVDAAFLVSPFTLQADEAGLTRVMNPSVEFFTEGAVTSAWVGTESWVAENPEAVERFQRAVLKSAEFANANLTDVQQHAIDRSELTVSVDQMPQSFFPTAFDQGAMEEIDAKLVRTGFFDEGIEVSEFIAPSSN